MKNFFGSQQRPRAPDGGEDSFLTGDELRDRKNVQLLLEAIGEVSSTLSLEHLLTDIVDKSIELTRAERGLLLLSAEGGGLAVRVARGGRREELIPPVQYSTTLAQQVAQSKKPLRKMVSSDSEAADLARSVFDLKLRAVMCAPLVVKEELIGVIYVDSRAAEREFSRADLSFFHALSRQLAIAIENARLVADSVEKARLEQELRIAAEIQRGLLPESFPEVAGIDLFGWYAPCDEATGDSYDFIPLEDGRLAFILGDVSGHGVGPALLAATARAGLRAYLRAIPDLGRVADCLHRDLREDLKPGMFMTFVLGIVDPKRGGFEYLNAGHPAPLLAREGEPVRLLDGVEPAFGFRDETPARGLRANLRRGDALIVYSDGLLEARSPGGELFGEERLKAALGRLRTRPAREITEGIVGEILEFTGEKRGDDLTLLALRLP